MENQLPELLWRTGTRSIRTGLLWPWKCTFQISSFREYNWLIVFTTVFMLRPWFPGAAPSHWLNLAGILRQICSWELQNLVDGQLWPNFADFFSYKCVTDWLLLLSTPFFLFFTEVRPVSANPVPPSPSPLPSLSTLTSVLLYKSLECLILSRHQLLREPKEFTKLFTKVVV